MMKVPFLDLGAMNARHRQELQAAAERVINSGWYILGTEVKAFEAEFAQWVGSPYAVGTSDGLSALTLALRAWKELGRLKEGDEVGVPANTFFASILAITENRLKPRLIEPDEQTFNLSAEGLKAAWTPAMKAVIAVHLYGQLAEMPAIKKICQEKGVLLLEDAAQAHGAMIEEVNAGAWGDAAAFSFYPGKNLGALGDAGMLVASDLTFIEMVRALRNYGSHEKYHHKVQGPNDRLDEIQAAFLRAKLPYLKADTQRRQAIAKRYREEICHPQVKLPRVKAGEASHVWHLFVVRVADREAWQQWLHDRGIQTAVHYPIAPHQQEAYAQELGGVVLPLTERLHREVLSLPISPVLTDEQVSYVIKMINERVLT
jgi:dTDP-4-amino-4,6-dideoxygalactose transaminase